MKESSSPGLGGLGGLGGFGGLAVFQVPEQVLHAGASQTMQAACCGS